MNDTEKIIRVWWLFGTFGWAIAACGLPRVAAAVDWQKVDENPDVRVYVDIDSVRGDGEIASAWTKFAHKAAQSFSGGSYRPNGMFVTVRCAERRWAVKQGILFSGPDLDGTRIFETEIPAGEIRWDAIARLSTADKIRERVCQTRTDADGGTEEHLRIRVIPPDKATRFVRGEHWTIYLDGTIDAGAADRLSEIIATRGINAASVYLNSRGGDLAAGQSVSGLITRYLSDMGISTDLFAVMAQVPSEDLYVLQPEEARTLRLVNDGRGVPEWSIEASEAGFYLRGMQDTAWGPGKVVIGCVSDGWMLMGFYSVTNAEEITEGAVRASIRIDEAFVPLDGKPFYAKNGDVVATADLEPATVERLRRAAEIGFAFHPPNPQIFWGFAVEVGAAQEKVERYFSACEAR